MREGVYRESNTRSEWFPKQIFFKKGNREYEHSKKIFLSKKGEKGEEMQASLVMKIIMSVLDGLFAILLIAFTSKSKDKTSRMGFWVMIFGTIANIVLMNV